MKEITIEKFVIPLKHLADVMWGRDCESHKTNRRGTGFYSCAAHGGYVVDARKLTTVEKERLDRYITSMQLHVAVQHRPEGEVIIGSSATEFQSINPRSKSISYNPALGHVEWKKLDVYVFEEDSDWCLLEHETDIRVSGFEHLSMEERQKQIDECFKRNHERRFKN